MNLKIQIEKDQDDFNDSRNIRQEFKSLNTDILSKYCYNSSLNFNVCILSLYGNLNVGTIIRTSNLMGCQNVIIFGKRTYDKRSAVGSNKYTKLIYQDGFIKETKNKLQQGDFELSVQKFYDCMIENECIPVFIEQHPKSTFLENINWKLHNDKKLCFIFGNEGEGIPKEIINKGLTIEGSFIICIRQLGVIKSLNVSSACSMILSNYNIFKMKQVIDIYNI